MTAAQNAVAFSQANFIETSHRRLADLRMQALRRP